MLNYWDHHGWWFLFFLLGAPRLTMLYTGVCFQQWAHPILFWLGWVCCPRVVGAIIGTALYWDANPAVCVFAWIFAILGLLGGISQGLQRVGRSGEA